MNEIIETPNSIGMHIIIVSDGIDYRNYERDIATSIPNVTAEHGCVYINDHIRKDHIHVLLSISDESKAVTVINGLFDLVALKTSEKPKKDVHITLLPPWHIPLINAFIRDQGQYHGSDGNSLDDEIRTIFARDSVGV